MCLFTLKDTMIIPVTWNNCHVSLALMKVLFLLKDAWSSDCCIDNSLQVSLSLFFSHLVRRELGQLRKTWLWMPALPPHCFPLVWSNRSGLWKRWIIILLGDKAKDADRPCTDGSGQVREQAWGDYPSTESQSRGQGWTLQVEGNHRTKNHSIRNSNSQVMTIERQKHIRNKGNQKEL